MRASLTLALTALACGGSSGSSGASPQAMNELSRSIASAAATYGSQASAMTDPGTCRSDESSYDAQVRPMVEQMQGMAPEMDQTMGSMGRGADADMTCAAKAMMAELDRHRSAACPSTGDMGPNRSEADRDVATMTQWANHQLVRSQAMASMMGTGMGAMGGGGMTTGHCVQNADGAYTMN